MFYRIFYRTFCRIFYDSLLAECSNGISNAYKESVNCRLEAQYAF
eukprot:COSAG01_NODE_60051_length_296_cov_2.350254_1_plen_44_part_01